MQEPSEAVLAIKIQDARQRFLDKLYVEDKRDQKEHPFHSLYTGLYMQYVDGLEEG